MRVLIEPRCRWRSETVGNVRVHSLGRRKSIERVKDLLATESGPDFESLKLLLAGLEGCCGVIAEADDWLFAATDKIHAYPVFYLDSAEGPMLSNSPRRLRDHLRSPTVDTEAVLEFLSAGYVTGPDTLVREINQLQAGEVLLWDKASGKLQIKDYYLFHSTKLRLEKTDDLIEELDELTNAIFQRIIEDAGGRPIWVPLSGGLDSRLVLCKLKELGYDDLRSFSYGHKGNSDAKVAGKVAASLNVPWRLVSDSRPRAAAFFRSQARRDYWRYADDLYIVPNLHTFMALKELTESGEMSEDSIIINGQSGDFIAGNHIPDLGEPPDFRKLIECILKKHYSHRRDFLADPARRTVLEGRISAALGRAAMDGPVRGEQDFAKKYEYWEWRERQCKRVVHGQKNYEYFGLGWELPLWEKEYLYFWREIPVELKKGRKLFVDYLNRMNFYNLFKDFHALMSRWPGPWSAVLPLGWGVKALLGRKAAESFYRFFDYFSQYGYLYAQEPYWSYLNKCRTHTSPVAFYAERWIEENMPEAKSAL